MKQILISKISLEILFWCTIPSEATASIGIIHENSNKRYKVSNIPWKIYLMSQHLEHSQIFTHNYNIRLISRCTHTHTQKKMFSSGTNIFPHFEISR